MNRGAEKWGDSNHMRVAGANVEFLRGLKLYKGMRAVLHTAGTVGFDPRFWSSVPLWNERQALCI